MATEILPYWGLLVTLTLALGGMLWRHMVQCQLKSQQLIDRITVTHEQTLNGINTAALESAHVRIELGDYKLLVRDVFVTRTQLESSEARLAAQLAAIDRKVDDLTIKVARGTNM